jgi:hypothetical protein
MAIIVKKHFVTATRIAQVSPLRHGGQITSPDAGLLLVLSDNTKHKWLIEGGAIPAIGSWLINDADLHTRYVVTEDKFAELFTVTAD